MNEINESTRHQIRLGCLMFVIMLIVACLIKPLFSNSLTVSELTVYIGNADRKDVGIANAEIYVESEKENLKSIVILNTNNKGIAVSELDSSTLYTVTVSLGNTFTFKTNEQPTSYRFEDWLTQTWIPLVLDKD